MKTTVVRPADATLREVLQLASAFAAFLVLFHIALTLWVRHEGYGYFRDEMYYLACGRHLAWGYVDHGPLVAVQARLAETLFGKSLVGLRMFAAIGGGLRVFLTGILCWALGGRRPAQVLAMLAVIVTPGYLGGDSYLSMNSIESTFWMTSLLALILIHRGASPRLWLLFGASAGLGLLNKPSMTFFLVALLAALLITPQRRLLKSPWMLVGVALLLLIVLPNLLWQIHNQWPTWEFLQNGKREGKNVLLGPLAFINSQIQEMHPLNLLVWLPGLAWLLRRREWRWLGFTFLLFLALMMALHAKNYYVVPIYPILFAAGGIAWESWRTRRSPNAPPNRLFAFPILESALILTGLIILPMSNPILAPPQWIAYTTAMHLRAKSSHTENAESGPLPQFFADRFGWQEEVDAITQIYNSLTPEERTRTVILCGNYGEASAVNFLGRGLPVAVSGHNTYWLWGPGPASADIVIDVEHTTTAHLQQYANSVQIVGQTGTEYSMPHEHKPIFLLRGMKQFLAALWPDKKAYI